MQEVIFNFVAWTKNTDKNFQVLPELTTWSAALFRSLPEFIQKQLLLERHVTCVLETDQS